jgi:ClpP class serine protease
MTPGDILWLFFVFSALQPVLKQRFLDASRQRHSRVILLVHRQEQMSILGFPVYRSIDVNDSEEVLRAIYLTDPAVQGLIRRLSARPRAWAHGVQ